MTKHALILGAGPIGLISAWQLLEKGWTVEIYEKQSLVGGMCRTWQWGEFLVDTGPHIYHTPDKELAQFWENKFGHLFVKGEFWCKNVKGGNFDQYWDYPLSWESISQYPKELKQRILDELDGRNSNLKANARNFAEYMEAEVGPTLKEMFFTKYPQKIWGISTEEMTPDWAPKRVEFRQKRTPFYHNQWNAVGKYGTGCIYESIRDEIIKLGGELHLNTEIGGIVHSDYGITGIQIKNGNLIRVNPGDVVISSLPLTLTARFLGLESNLKFRGICSIFLAYNQPDILPENTHWLYYDSEQVYFNRITESKKLSPFVAPSDKTFLTAEITYEKGDEIDLADPNSLMETVARQVELVGLAKYENLIDYSLNYEPFVYPLQISGYQETLAKTRSLLSQFEQLYSIGTGGDFNYADSQVLFHKAFDTVDILTNQNSSYLQTKRRVQKISLNPIVQIDQKNIGGKADAYIIAEAGLNHNGDIELAKKLIDEAKHSGCHAIKFQTFKAKSRVSNKVKSVKYAEQITGMEETIYEMFDRLAMPFEEQRDLFNYARQEGIEIFSTPFDFESVDFLESFGVNLYKIASMDLVNIPLIKYVASTMKPIILSTGMSTLGQIEDAVNTVVDAGNPNLMLLHCNSSYPAAPEEMNLNVIQTLKTTFNVPVGLSDHTFGLFVSHTALVLGADIIERHFTLDRTMEGPDHILSSEPSEFAELVRMAKELPIILGDGVKKIQPNEYDTINTQRKSLYAIRDIAEGEVFREDMIAIKGPGGGLLPKYFDIVTGRKARENIPADHPITWDSI